MNPIAPGSTRFVRLEQLFNAALELAPSDRAAFIVAACADERDLQLALTEMLAHVQSDETGVHNSIEQVAASLVIPADRSGERIGPYVLTARIRVGGMAEVYEANRADGQFAQRVAIKIVRGDRALASMSALFQAERELLARLNHPHICQFFDGGSTASGEPYFVMERLDGVALPKACLSQSLPWRTVTTHVLNLCQAVAHIHGQLIVHRDIKPDNVLIAEGPTGPVVKLLDFGIAGTMSDSDQHANAPRQNWHSQEYAAPEVVAGQTAGVGADIFSLGRLLQDLAPLFPKDRREELLQIAAHATAEVPSQRYLSVDALMADIGRMRDRLPLAIRPRQPMYLLWRFAQRHALALGVTAAIAVMLTVTLTREVKLRQAAQAATAVAVQERNKAEAMRDFLLESYEAANPDINEGRDLPISEFIDQQVAALQRDDTKLAPAARIDLMATLGNTMMNLGRFDRAEQTLAAGTALADTNTQRGNVQWARITLTRAQNAQRQDQFEQAEVWFKEVEQAKQWQQAGLDALQIESNLYSSWAVVKQRTHQLDAAESMIQRGLKARQQYDAQRGDAAETASLLVTLGAIQSARGDLAAALSSFQSAHAENLSQGRGITFPHLALLGWLGITLDRQSKPEQAEPYLREAITVAERLFSKPHPKLSSAYGNLGTMYLVNGRYIEAAPLLEQGLKVLKEMGDNTSAVYQTRINNLSRLALEREDLDTAEPLLAELVKLRRMTFGNQSDRTIQALLAQARLALLEHNATEAMTTLAEVQLAMQSLDESVANPLRPDVLLIAAEAAAMRGDANRARANLQKFTDGHELNLAKASDRDHALWQFQHGRVLQTLQDFDGAKQAYLDSVKAFGGDARCAHPICAQVQLHLAELAIKRGDRLQAKSRLQQALPILEANMAPNSKTLHRARALSKP